MAVVEEAVEKERRLNRRPERKVREATPAPANININNNTNTNTNTNTNATTTNNNNNNSRSAARCIGGAGDRRVRSERLLRRVSRARAAVIVGVCAGIAGKEVVNRSRQNYAKSGKYEHCCPTTGR